MDARALAERHAPILRFSRDAAGRAEYFYPMDAEAYVRAAALYAPGPRRLVPRGKLQVEVLLQYPTQVTTDLYLAFASESLMPPLPSARALTAPSRPPFMRPEWWDHLLDALYEVGARVLVPLFLRLYPQRLPLSVWQEALARYRAFSPARGGTPPPALYYIVQPTEPYIVLHYWFFYAFNDWGTGHGGLNDHEGDWESIHLFLESVPPYRVRWLAYAAHGVADLERADSPRVEWADRHPVVYVGCGSHASYFRPGVYKALDWAQGDGHLVIGPPNGEGLLDDARDRRYVSWRLQDVRTLHWPWHFRGFWGTRFRYQGPSRWIHALHALSGPGGPIWLAGQGRVRPQWRDPYAWAGFRRYPWEWWRPKPTRH